MQVIQTVKEFEAELYVLTQEEGGRHTPFLNNYRPQFYVRTADVTGKFAVIVYAGVPGCG